MKVQIRMNGNMVKSSNKIMVGIGNVVKANNFDVQLLNSTTYWITFK